MNFDQRLEEDDRIQEKMLKLEREGKRDTQEYKDLHYTYYVLHDDIRLYWSTY